MTVAIPSRSPPRAGAAALKLGKRWLYIVHRWLGIFTCLLCVLWFVSGVVMAYVPYPGLSDRDRMAFAQPIDWSQVRVSPGEALAAAGLERWPSFLRLNMLEGRPVYRIDDDGRRIGVSAVDGRRIEEVGAGRAVEVVRRLRPDAPAIAVRTVQRDQWTVAQGFNPHRPLHRVSLGDAKETSLYVSSRTGEVVNDTTGAERFWNWVGSVPHWIYFTVVRQDVTLWRHSVMWSGGPALIGAVLGVWVGVLRLRVRDRYPKGRMTPYAGWMKWHHVGGLIGGLFVVTWLFSGWLSVNPFGWFVREPTDAGALVRYSGNDRPVFPADAARMRTWTDPDAREARFVWLAGRPLVVTMRSDLGEDVRDGVTGQSVHLTDAEIFAAARTLVPDAPVTIARRLTAEDAYWYSHHTERRLPVLRAGFDDAAGAWFHIDPTTGEILGRSTHSARTYRWLFNLLHDFDLRALRHNRPLWDLVIWSLSIVGLVVSVSGVVIGWRRLVRKSRRQRPGSALAAGRRVQTPTGQASGPHANPTMLWADEAPTGAGACGDQ